MAGRLFSRTDQPFYRIVEGKHGDNNRDPDDKIVLLTLRARAVSDPPEDSRLSLFAGRTKKKIDHFFPVEFALRDSISLSISASSTVFPLLPQLDRS